MKHSVFLLAVGLLCWTSAHAATLTYSYDSNKDEAENGTALQAAVNAASSGDELKVQAGTYIGNFTMKDGVNVSGGWDANFETQTDYATILDANASGRVLNQPANFTTLTIWENLTIQNGKLTANLDTYGAGVFLRKNGQVKHCMIQDNTFTYTGVNCMGGGVGNNEVNTSSDVLVDNCIIRQNLATHGGGVRIKGTIQNSIIENNSTTNNAGGGAHIHTGRMVNCIVRNNLSGGDTGGVRAYGTCLIDRCTIENNISTGQTGGVSLEGAATLSNSIIQNNTSGTTTGGVRSAAKSNIYNNLIYNNTAGTARGGLSIESALANVINNTIVCNNQLTGTGSQAGVFITNNLNPNGTFFVNNVVWGNMSNGNPEAQNVYYISRYDKTQGQRSYNAIIGQKGDDSAETSIQLTTDDPGFKNAANGEFSLLSTSVLLDRGNSDKVTVAKDLDGNDRIVNAAVDMGAYEYPIVASDVYVLVGEDLQAKINNTAKGYTVYVQAGTFYGNFTMKDGVNVRGGWDANFETKTDYATVLDAQENGRVLNQPANFSTPTIWDNFTIQHGKLTANLDTYGSGVFLRKNGQVKHCIIQDNTFTYSGTCMGGGVGNNEVNAKTDVLIDDCIIRRNTATHGGGVRIAGTIQNSVINNNTTTNNAAGGIHLQGGRAINCEVHDNSATGAGGIRALGACEIINCDIHDNKALGTGNSGGVILHNGACMYNSKVRNNTSGGDTGGVRITRDGTNNAQTVVANCLIAGNSAGNRIGGLAIENNTGSGQSTWPRIIGNTIVGNIQASSTNPNWCGVRLNIGSSVQFCNNVVWGNKVGDEVQPSQIHLLVSYANQANNFAHNAVVWSGYLADDGSTRFNNDEYPTGVNTIFLDMTTDPGFTDAATGDYTLAYPSDLIDSGHGGYFYGTTDLAGNTRKVGTIDRGCYEYTYEAAVPMTYNRTVTAGRYGTICLPYAVATADVSGAQPYKVLSFSDDSQTGLVLEEVDVMEAGKPYFFLASADNVSFGYTVQGLPVSAKNENGLYGTIDGTTVGADEGNYVLQSNELRPVEGDALTLGANRAYVKLAEIPEYTESAPSPRRRVLRIQQQQGEATAMEEISQEPKANSQKLFIDGQLVIIREGVRYNAQGSRLQ